MKKIVMVIIAIVFVSSVYAGIECDGNVCTFVPDVKNEHIAVVYEGKGLRCNGEELSKQLNADLFALEAFKPNKDTKIKYVFIISTTAVDTSKFSKSLLFLPVKNNVVEFEKKKYSLSVKDEMTALKKVLNAE